MRHLGSSKKEDHTCSDEDRTDALNNGANASDVAQRRVARRTERRRAMVTRGRYLLNRSSK